jgi:hypothetical protein
MLVIDRRGHRPTSIAQWAARIRDNRLAMRRSLPMPSDGCLRMTISAEGTAIM